MTNFQKIISVFKWSLGSIVYLISFLIPKKRNLWVFGSWFGQKYADNSKYLFEYINNNHTDIETVWLSTSRKTIETIRSKGFSAVITFSFKGFIEIFNDDTVLLL